MTCTQAADAKHTPYDGAQETVLPYASSAAHMPYMFECQTMQWLSLMGNA